jgi:hypothetical protein
MIKKTTFLVIILTFSYLNTKAQDSPKNLIELSTGLYYFKGITTKFKPLNYFPVYLVYSRLLKGKPYFIGANFYHYRFSDHSHPELKQRGDVQEKFFMIFGAHAGYRFPITQKRTFLAKAGLVYRLGWEQQFYSRLNVGGRIEYFSTDYKYRNPGLELSAEQQFHLTDRWSISIGGGYQYFLSRTTTNHHLWVSAGAGYAF